MSCNCNCSHCPGNTAIAAVLLILLGSSLILGILRLLGKLIDMVALPHVAWIPLTVIATVGTVWGLWFGFRQHGRAEPLTVGVFGLLVTLLGFVFSFPIALLGVAIVLTAAAWSTFAYAEQA